MWRVLLVHFTNGARVRPPRRKTGFSAATVLHLLARANFFDFGTCGASMQHARLLLLLLLQASQRETATWGCVWCYVLIICADRISAAFCTAACQHSHQQQTANEHDIGSA